MLAPNTILQSRYRVIRQLGQGGMGTVYEAVDQRLDTTIALKESHFTDERLRKQFEREARLLARLRHPAMTRVIDHFEESDGQFLVMDFISGEDLWEMIKRRGAPFPPEEVFRWGDQLLDALDYLHTQESPIIHRDIKPQNLKLTGRGQIILLDFGLAKGFAGQISHVMASSSIFGYTPNYAPLEQIQGTGTNPRSDLYSLAATLYHLTSGAPPPDALTRATASLSDLPDPLRPADELNPQVTPALATVLKRAMSLNPNHRPSSASEMRQTLREASDHIMAPREDGAETIVLPPTIVSSPQTQPTQIRETANVPPTEANAETQKTPEILPTLASPDPSIETIRASAPLHLPKTFVQTTPKLNRLPWLSISLVGLLLVGIAIAIFAFRGSSEGNLTGGNSGSTGNPVKVGVFADLTGQLSSFGQSTKNGIQMATDEINAAGGINGRKIELVIEDSQGEPSKSADAATKLIQKDNVVALIGSEGASTNSIAAAPSAQQAQVPMISPSSTNPKVTQIGDYIFRVCFIDPFQGEVMAKFAANTLKAKRAAILSDFNSDYSKGLTQLFKSNFTKLGGEIVMEQAYTQRDRDFAGQLNAIRTVKPDVIYVPGYYQEAGIIAKRATQLGINAPLLGGDGWDAPQLWDLGSDYLNGNYISNHYSVDGPSPKTQKFVTAYKAKYNGVAPDALAALAYDAMLLLADAIKRAGTTDGPRLRDAIAQTTNFPGVTGNITINAERNPVKPAVVLELRDYKFVYKETIQP